MPKHRKGPATPQLADEYLAGFTTVELGAKYRMSPSAVNGRLRRAGVRLREATTRICYNTNPAFVAAAVVAYNNGESVPDIASRVGVGRSTIRQALSRSDVKLRRNGTRSRTVKIPTDPVKLGYFAGLLDGEGNLQMKRNKHGGRADSTGCKLSIYSTTPSVMGWLTTNVGGKVRWDYKRQERKGWLPCGMWEVYRAHDVLSLLQWCLPVLLVKSKAAKKLVAFLRSKMGYDSPPTIIH